MVLKHDEVRSDNDDSSAVEAECGALIESIHINISTD